MKHAKPNLQTTGCTIRERPYALANIATIKDGALAFIGMTANLHKPMREFLNHRSQTSPPNLIGGEKAVLS
jgi:hypothetical protein